MDRYRNRYAAPGRRPSSSGIWYSEELLFGATGGYYRTPKGGSVEPRRELYQFGDSFEETFPKYPFSELIRIGINIAHWISHRRRPMKPGRSKPQTWTCPPIWALRR